MTERPALTIVIPCYNSAATIGPLVAEIAALHIDGGHDVVLVNDGSRDDTARVCREAARVVAQSGQLADQSGFGCPARQAPRALPVELPLHERLRSRADLSLRWPVSVRRRSVVAGDAERRPHGGRARRAPPRTEY